LREESFLRAKPFAQTSLRMPKPGEEPRKKIACVNFKPAFTSLVQISLRKPVCANGLSV
jgi:hypothetical protein